MLGSNGREREKGWNSYNFDDKDRHEKEGHREKV
jgi:hypothetical protein